MKQQPTKNSFLRIGVTGGIGSGKSTVCAQFAALGRTVLSADSIARELTDTKDVIKTEIKKLFGDDSFFESGLVNRKALSEIIFKNPPLRNKLNAIIHPHVFQAIESRIANLPLGSKQPYCLIEAALIYESGMEKELDYVVVVHAEEENRISRIQARDQIGREAVMARLQSQMEVEKKKKLADFVLENDGSPDELLTRVKFLDQLFKYMVPSAPAGNRSVA